jgi:uncharacterized protein
MCQYPDPFLNATVDEFHIFDHALEEDVIASLMDSPGGDEPSVW